MSRDRKRLRIVRHPMSGPNDTLLSLPNRLARAIASGEYRYGVAALLRSKNLHLPGADFFQGGISSIYEKRGLIHNLDAWIYRVSLEE